MLFRKQVLENIAFAGFDVESIEAIEVQLEEMVKALAFKNYKEARTIADAIELRARGLSGQCERFAEQRAKDEEQELHSLVQQEDAIEAFRDGVLESQYLGMHKPEARPLATRAWADAKARILRLGSPRKALNEVQTLIRKAAPAAGEKSNG